MTTPNDMIQLHFTTPDTTKWVHLVVHAKSGGAALFTITEAPTGGLESPTGTIDIHNTNRNSANTSALTISYDGTAATGGTVLWTEYVGQGTANAGESRGAQEFLLRQNTAYAISLFDTSAITATLILSWYEHINTY